MQEKRMIIQIRINNKAHNMTKKILSIVLLSFFFQFTNAQSLVLLNEGFENWPANGWNTYELAINGGWVQDPSLGHNSDHCAKLPYASGAQNNNWLVSPMITLDDTTTYQLSYFDFSFGSACKIMISNGSGDPNDGDFNLELISPEATWWKQETLDLSDYQGQDIYIAFNGYTNTSQQWRVDDVLVAPDSFFDAGLTEDFLPSGYNPNSGIEDIIITLKNYGTETITEFDVDWTVDDIFQTQFNGSGYSIAAGEEVQVIIGSYDFNTGNYSIEAQISLINDAYAANDHISTEYSVALTNDLIIQGITPSNNFPEEGFRDVNVIVHNNGDVPLSNFIIHWSVNDVEQLNFNVSASILPGESSSINIGEYNFLSGLNLIEISIPLEFDLNPENNSMDQVYTVASFYEDFEGEFPSLLWESHFSTRGNFASQNNDPNNYHVYMLSSNTIFGEAADTLYTPLLNINEDDSVFFKARFPIYLAGTMQLVWKDGITGEVHLLQDPVSSNLGWVDYSFDISDAAGINRIGWVCSTDNVIGDFNMDDIYSSAPIFFHDNDLMVKSFHLDTVPQINIEQTITCKLYNIGINDILGFDYTVKLMEGTTELYSINGQNINSTGNLALSFPYTFTEVGYSDLHIEADYVIDDSPLSNYSPFVRVHPVPENTIYHNLGEAVQLSSSLPFGMSGYDLSGDEDFSQSLFYSSEINTIGEIYGLKYYYNNQSNYSGSASIKIWLAETAETNLESGFLPSENFLLVFDGIIEVQPGQAYTYISFETPFMYDGTNNLVVQNYSYDKEFIFTPTKYYSTVASEEYRSVFLVNKNLIDTDNPTLDYTISTNYPFTQFVISPEEEVGTIYGLVTDIDSQALEGAEISVDGTTVSTLSGDLGDYQLPALQYGEYTITASLFGYDDSTQTQNIDQDNLNLDFTLEEKPLLLINAIIVGSNDIEVVIPNVEVNIEGYFPYVSTTDTEGAFLINDVYGNTNYTLNLSIYGYDDYTQEILINDQNLDLGTIVLQESFLSVYNVNADGNAWQTQVDWEIPNTGEKQTIINDLEVDYSGYSNEENENVWLGNFFENPGTVTINDVDIHWTFIDGGVEDFVSVDILNADGEVIASSDHFLTPFNEWINVDLPNMTVTGNYFIMIHWEGNPETTHFASYNWSWDSSVPNTGVIKYPGEDVQYITDFLQSIVPVINLMIRPNVVTISDNGNDNNNVSYNIYKGPTNEIFNAENWDQLNSNPISTTSYVDGNWPTNMTDGAYTYAVEAIYTEGNSEYTFSNSIDIVITGVEDIEQNTISIFPNPAVDLINVTGVNSSELRLYNALGEVVYSHHASSENIQINVSQLPAGNYILDVIYNGKSLVKKITITKY